MSHIQISPDSLSVPLKPNLPITYSPYFSHILSVPILLFSRAISYIFLDFGFGFCFHHSNRWSSVNTILWDSFLLCCSLEASPYNWEELNEDLVRNSAFPLRHYSKSPFNVITWEKNKNTLPSQWGDLTYGKYTNQSSGHSPLFSSNWGKAQVMPT